MPNRNDEIEPITRARVNAATAVENEYRRLLYVAMTRAADRLVVCGALGKQAMPPGCWYQLVQDGLTASELLVEEEADHRDGRVLRFRTTPRQSAAPAPSEISQMTLALEPAWLNASLPTEPAIDAVLAPSSAMPHCSAAFSCTGCCNHCQMFPLSGAPASLSNFCCEPDVT